MQAGAKGPRQPWHDLHCRIDGPAAYDVLKNFEQRWRKATKWRDRFRRVSHWKDDALIKLERISWILSPSRNVPNDHPTLWVSKEEDPENWHVQVVMLPFKFYFFVKIILKFSGVVDVFFLTMQVFRSIDSGSLKGFPSDSKEASKQVSQHLYFLSSTAMMENILIASLGIFSKVLALLMLVLFLPFSLVLYCFKTVTGTN